MNKQNHTDIFALLVVLFLASISTIQAQAAVIPLTGGDPGEGYSRAGGPVAYAYNTGGSPPTEFVQGVTFTGLDLSSLPANISQTGLSAFNWGSTTGLDFGPSPTANDTALATMLSNTFFATGSTASLTLGGLTAGTVYQVDLLAWSHDSGNRSGTWTFSGATSSSDTFTEVTGAASALDIREVLAADSNGNITVSLSGGVGNPTIQAFSVIATPEPSGIALLLTGAAGLCFWTRRNRCG